MGAMVGPGIRAVTARVKSGCLVPERVVRAARPVGARPHPGLAGPERSRVREFQGRTRRYTATAPRLPVWIRRPERARVPALAVITEVSPRGSRTRHSATVVRTAAARGPLAADPGEAVSPPSEV